MDSAPGLLMELARTAVPDVPLSVGVQKATTGVLWQDFLPLLTMLPCAKTLAIHWRCQRYSDVVVFAVGTLLAVIYHWLHMHPEGIANTELLGLPGSAWRGLDILMAQGLLARTLGHAVGARTGLVLFLANLAFPATLLSYAHLLAGGVLTLGFASKVLVVVLLATLAAKAALEGWHTLPRYCPRRGPRTLWCFMAGFAVFPLPELFPNHYWLFHSLWHLAMAEGYQLLYVQLEGLHLAADSQEDSQPTSDSSSLSDGSSSGCSAAAASFPGGFAGGLFSALPLRRRRSSQRLAALAARKEAY